MKTLMRNKNFITSVVTIVFLSALAGWILHVQTSGSPASSGERCFYAASSSYYIHDDSWKGLTACQGLENWELLGVKARIDNMRSR